LYCKIYCICCIHRTKQYSVLFCIVLGIQSPNSLQTVKSNPLCRKCLPGLSLFSLSDQLFSVVVVVVKKNRFPLVFRGVDSYLPRFTSSHGQIRGRRVMFTFFECFQMSGEFYHSIKHGLAFFTCFMIYIYIAKKLRKAS
jgi:hypothetical protein